MARPAPSPNEEFSARPVRPALREISSRFRAVRIRAYVVKGSSGVITASWVIQMAAKRVGMALSISIRMEGECFEGRIMQRILNSVSGPRRFLVNASM